jgi:hypothetical protein
VYHRGDGKRTGANLPDAFEVSRVCDDAREFLELIELIQLRLSFFFTAINSAHRLWPSVSTTRLQTAIDRGGEGRSDGDGNAQRFEGTLQTYGHS